MNESYLEYLSLREFYKTLIDSAEGISYERLINFNGKLYDLDKILDRIKSLEDKLFKDFKVKS